MTKTVNQRVREYRLRQREEGMTEISLLVPAKDVQFFRHLAAQSRGSDARPGSGTKADKERSTEFARPRLTRAQLRLAETWAVQSGLRHRIDRAGLTMPELLAWNIAHEIVERGWPEGHPLGTLQTLRAKYQVGPRIVTTALRMLQARSIVGSKGGPEGQFVVRHPGLESASYVASVFVQTRGQTHDDLRATCLAVTTCVAERCAARLDAAGREQIKACLLFESSLDGSSPGKDLQRFQLLLASLTGDPMLVLFMEIVTRSMRYRSSYYTASKQARDEAVSLARQAHAAIARALLLNDAAAARATVSRHLAHPLAWLV
ncbi:MAG: FCD domain-containing protein [Burkholderiaceae bacterium]